MNDIRRIIPCLLLLLLLGACTAELLGGGAEAGGDGLTLSLATRAATRVPEEGEDTFNENKIERADVYFFDCDATGNAEGGCIYARMGLVPSPVTNSTTDYTLQIPLDRTIISDDTSYYVYVVANHSLGYTDETAKQKTLAEIKATRIETAWKEGYTAGEAVIENSLVMDGGEQITIQAAQTTKEQIKQMMYGFVTCSSPDWRTDPMSSLAPDFESASATARTPAIIQIMSLVIGLTASGTFKHPVKIRMMTPIAGAR